MVKEMYKALTSAGVDPAQAVEAIDAMVEAMEGARTDRQVTKWATLAALALVAAIAIRVFTL